MRKLLLRKFVDDIPIDINRYWDWNEVAYETTPNGRKVARHPSGMGTVMSFDDGMERAVLVLDSIYRQPGGYASGGMGGYTYYFGNELVNDLLPPERKLHVTTEIGYIFDPPITVLPTSGCTDDELNLTPQCAALANQDINTSKYNTDSLVSLGANAQMANYCRSITINGTGCDLANINTMVRIYVEMITLDAMDPTAASNPLYSVMGMFDNNNGVGTSSYIGEYYYPGQRYFKLMFENSYVYYNGHSDSEPVWGYSMIPILEMNVI